MRISMLASPTDSADYNQRRRHVDLLILLYFPLLLFIFFVHILPRIQHHYNRHRCQLLWPLIP